MAFLKYNRHLIRSNEEDSTYNQTHIGQASWAVGPHTCSACEFFCEETALSGICAKFETLMASDGVLIPRSAASCRFFRTVELRVEPDEPLPAA
jgi:hypothetical protein